MGTKPTIGIVGGGTVGKATARAYLEHYDVRIFDTDITRRTHSWEKVVTCDIVFLCLPTPQKPGSLECDLSAIDEFFTDLFSTITILKHETVQKATYVLRSTVPIGTTKRLASAYKLNLLHSPEFLTARCATVDAQTPTRNIIGVPCDRPYAQSHIHLLALYYERFPHVPVLLLTSDESEAVKMFQNAFFAVKVSFWNEMRTLSDKLGLDWDTVLNGILADGRIHPSHTQVPGPDGKFGFGGACLPKDLASLIQQFYANGSQPTICGSAYRRNVEEDRK